MYPRSAPQGYAPSNVQSPSEEVGYEPTLRSLFNPGILSSPNGTALVVPKVRHAEPARIHGIRAIGAVESRFARTAEFAVQ